MSSKAATKRQPHFVKFCTGLRCVVRCLPVLEQLIAWKEIREMLARTWRDSELTAMTSECWTAAEERQRLPHKRYNLAAVVMTNIMGIRWK